MKFRNVAMAAARNAAKVLLQEFGKKASIKQKPNKSLVTSADLKANATIIRIITKYFMIIAAMTQHAGQYR